MLFVAASSKLLMKLLEGDRDLIQAERGDVEARAGPGEGIGGRSSGLVPQDQRGSACGYLAGLNQGLARVCRALQAGWVKWNLPLLWDQGTGKTSTWKR